MASRCAASAYGISVVVLAVVLGLIQPENQFVPSKEKKAMVGCQSRRNCEIVFFSNRCFCPRHGHMNQTLSSSRSSVLDSLGFLWIPFIEYTMGVMIEYEPPTYRL